MTTQKNSGQGNKAPASKKARKSHRQYEKAGIGDRAPEDMDTGEREAAERNKKDKLWTFDSKARWGADQPTLQDLLGEKEKREKKAAKKD